LLPVSAYFRPDKTVHKQKERADVLGLGRKLQFLAFENFSDVQVEKVAIKDGLNNTRNDGNPILEALGVVAVDPVKDVEETVRSERKQVVGSD